MSELNAWLSPLLSWIATYLAHSTLLIGGLWLALKFTPRAGHSVRETLWKTALVGGMVSSGLQVVCAPPLTGVVVLDFPPRAADAASSSSTSLANASETTSEWFIPNRQIAGQFGVVNASSVGDPADSVYIVRIVEDGAVDGALWSSFPSELQPTPAEVASVGLESTAKSRYFAVPRSLIGGIAIALGIGFAAVGIGRALWQTHLLRRRLAACVPVTGGLAYRLLTELRGQTPNCAEVELLTSDEEPEPAAFGVWKWSIILPERAERELTVDELRTLLAHELAHLVRGDAVWLAISRFACSCLAFQPLNQLARREWQKSAEFLSDAWAVSHTGTPLALARCLTEVAGWRHSASSFATALAATGRRSGLTARVERLLQDWSPNRRGEELARSPRMILSCGTLLAALTLAAPRFSVHPPEVVAAENAGHSQTTEPSATQIAHRLAAQLASERVPVPMGIDLHGDLMLPAWQIHATQNFREENTQLLLSIEMQLQELEHDLRTMTTLLSNSGIDESFQLRIRRIEGVSAALLQTRRNSIRWIQVEQFVEGPAEFRTKSL